MWRHGVGVLFICLCRVTRGGSRHDHARLQIKPHLWVNPGKPLCGVVTACVQAQPVVHPDFPGGACCASALVTEGHAVILSASTDASPGRSRTRTAGAHPGMKKAPTAIGWGLMVSLTLIATLLRILPHFFRVVTPPFSACRALLSSAGVSRAPEPVSRPPRRPGTCRPAHPRLPIAELTSG